MPRLRLHPILEAGVLSFANRSRAWDQVLTPDVDADLLVGILRHLDYVHGAFERGDKGPDGFQRGSGGGVVHVSPGSIWLMLVLRNPRALDPTCTADKLLNRYVRPLLRALTRTSGVPVSYFGRDWLSAHKPVAMVSFAHDASSGQALIEAFIGIDRAFSMQDRPSFMGKKAVSLREAAHGKAIEPRVVAEAILASYSALTTDIDHAADDSRAWPPQGRMPYQPSWAAEVDEAIGTIGAGPDADGKMRVGGELMASRDAIARLQEAIATLPRDASEEDVGRIVDEAMTSHGAVIFGVRSLASLRDVIVRALRT